jgi:hypothetical protein
MLLMVGIFGLGKSGNELMVWLNEKAPRPINMDQFSATYQGSQWLRLSGRFATNLKSIKRDKPSSRSDGSTSYVYVPFVGSTWQDGDPVHVVVGYGPFPAIDAVSLADKRIRNVTTVDVLQGPDQDRGRVLVEANYVDPFLWTFPDREPSAPWKSGLMFLFLLVLIGRVAVSMLVTTYGLIRGRGAHNN